MPQCCVPFPPAFVTLGKDESITIAPLTDILTYSLIVAEILSARSLRAEPTLRPVDLRCEYLKNPLGIDRTSPELSWKLEAAPHAGRGLKQAAFQILVATTEDSLGAENGDLWDSGRVVSDESINVVYAGRPLVSRQSCWWKVRIWDQDGHISAWSEPSLWSMGLLHANDWTAKWIGLDGGDETRPEDPSRTRLPARMLRRVFQAKKHIKRATVYLSGLGFFDLYINGAKVGDHIMDPALTEYSKRVLYLTFDVTDRLKPGENALGVILGNGRFFAPRGRGHPVKFKTYGYPKLLLQLEIEYADGSRQQLVSDDDWKITTDGPIRANNEYDGEEYDARKEIPGWDQPGFNDSGWKKVELVQPPGGHLQAQMLEPTRIIQTLRDLPIRICGGHAKPVTGLGAITAGGKTSAMIS